jgi:hypothetical protein
MDQDPTRHPQLAEAFAAFAQLLATAEKPIDEAVVASGITMRIERKRRRRRLRIASAVLAVAASLVVAVGLIVREPAAEQAVALAPPAPVAVQDQAPPSPVAADDSFDLPSWEDELAAETAALSTAVETTEQRWHEQPDGIALLKSQVDQFEQEMGNAAL